MTTAAPADTTPTHAGSGNRCGLATDRRDDEADGERGQIAYAPRRRRRVHDDAKSAEHPQSVKTEWSRESGALRLNWSSTGSYLGTGVSAPEEYLNKLSEKG